jgi:hypothetical protein
MQGWAKSELYLLDTTGDAPAVPIVEGVDALFSVEIVDDQLYIVTNHNAPRYKLLKTMYTSRRASIGKRSCPRASMCCKVCRRRAASSC